ncbi:MAG TPA: divalent metal cation transporter [Candidatus Saccharimonadales bacterium]|jgi:NRAMP (natural resistance-associated macrophage protein)-like metal ion transporter|nr:divalent metal cation transporter [Candidatus Saccharimonadales bacterium]
MAKKDYLKRSAEFPAEVLDETIQVGQQLSHNLPTDMIARKGKDYWHMLGPGLTTGASDDDPSGIATYSQTGAQYGFQLLWLAAFTYPLMSIVQEMCARIGLVTGRGLAGNIRLHFSPKVIYLSALFLFAANAFNIGADLGAMAKGVQLLEPRWSFSFLVLGFTLLSFGLQIFTPYARYARYLKWLAMVLFAYVASALLAHLRWSEVIKHAIVPHITFSKDQLLLICAILGTTISPYLFFWQTSQEVEEQILQGKTTVKMRQGAVKEDVRSMRIDVWSGMFLSNVVMFFIIATCGALLFSHGITNINSASQAAEALRPFAGNQTYLLFAVGIIGTGLLTIPVLAGSSSYAIAESFRWKEGLDTKLHKAHAFYGIIIIAMLVGLGLNFIGLDPIKALIYSAVANGIVAPIVLVPIVLISSNKKIMGQWVNKPIITFIGWLVVALMAIAGVAAILTL